MRIAGVLVLILAVGAGVGGYLFYQAGGEGSDTAVEQWIGSQLRRIVNGHLNAELTFDMLDYQYPQSVVLTNVRLTAADPAAPNGRTAIVEAKRLELTLDKVPSQGQPIIIRAVQVSSPIVRLLADRSADNADTDTFNLVGFSDLVRSKDTAPTTPPPPLSDVFRMNRVSVSDGQFLFDPRTRGEPPMRLDGFTTTMHFDAEDAGWYAYDLKVNRAPVLDLAAAGRLNLDTLVVELRSTTLAVDLASERRDVLPPQLQQLLKQYDARGTLSIGVTGTLPVETWQESQLDIELRMADAHIADGEYQLPIQTLSIDAAVREGRAELGDSFIDALGGRVTLAGGVALNPALRADLRIELKDLYLEKLLRGGSDEATATELSGLVNGELHYTGGLTELMTQADGTGEVNITQGKLAMIPVIGRVTGELARAARVTGSDGDRTGTDTASFVFDLVGNHAKLTSIELSTALLAATGTGTVGFDQSLNLDINAGPLKKLNQSLGILGRAIGQVTDGLSRYRVTGTIQEPQIAVLLLSAPSERATTDTPRETPASELFEDMQPRREKQDEADDKWEERRKQRDGMFSN